LVGVGRRPRHVACQGDILAVERGVQLDLVAVTDVRPAVRAKDLRAKLGKGGAGGRALRAPALWARLRIAHEVERPVQRMDADVE
jgi:hypothetical protein